MYNLVIGLDISKSTLDATCVRFAEKGGAHGSFLNKKLGFQQLDRWIGRAVSGGDRVLVCMEHTGHYAQKLVGYLRGRSYDVAQVNPLKVKRSMGLRREKSDKADSMAIALYGLKFQEDLRVNVSTDAEFLDLQLLLAHRSASRKKCFPSSVRRST
jgi:transposase